MTVTTDILKMRSYARALASGTRLRILATLAECDELGVDELSRVAGHSQPLISWHLRRLRTVGLVRRRRVGREVRYALDAERLAALQAQLSEFVEELSAIRVSRVAEREAVTRQTMPES